MTQGTMNGGAALQLPVAGMKTNKMKTNDMPENGVSNDEIAKQSAEAMGLVARMQLTSGPARFEGSSRIYRVPAGWESAFIARDPAVASVQSAFALEDALADTNVHTIVVKKGAPLTLETISAACRRHGTANTVFFEGE